MEETAIPQLVRFSAGFVYRDLFNLSKQLVMKAFRVGMTRRGEVSSDRHVLAAAEIDEVLRGFTPSSLVGFDVRSGPGAGGKRKGAISWRRRCAGIFNAGWIRTTAR